MGSPQINSTIPAPALMYARLLRENDDLIVQGKGDSTEAETLADRMDGSWYAMKHQGMPANARPFRGPLYSA